MSMPVEGVRVRAPARLHFGVLDLRGMLGRRFGGMGAAVPAPALELEAERGDGYSASGPDAERAAGFARRYAEAVGLPGGARIRVTRAMPVHSGLGSGTQLALSVARALAELYGQPHDVATLARQVGRGARSGVGTWLFERGGFVLEGGRREGAGLAPLLTRLPMPESWRCVVAVPASSPGLSGDAEAEAFRTLPPPPEREVEHIAHLVLMQLLPALVEEDLADFGSALAEVQRVTGRWFAASQGGPFAPGPTAQLIARFQDAGAAGVGQSSWGPAVYGLAGSDGAAERLAGIAEEEVGTTGLVVSGAFANRGAVVERLMRGASPD
jgi:beta-RFAP synthase